MKLLEKIRRIFEKRNYVNEKEKIVEISNRSAAILLEYKTFQAMIDEKLFTITTFFEEKETRKEEITQFVVENCNRGTIALILETDVRYDLRLQTERCIRENKISLFFSEM